MAQVTGGSDFDFEWEERTNVCLRLLREAADLISSDGVDALRADQVVDAFIWVLATRLPPVFFQPGKPRLPLRFFEGDTPAKPVAADSCGRLRAGGPKPEDAETVALLVGIIESAASAWADGDPEKPDTLKVLNQLLAVLWSKQLARRPPSKTGPRGAF